TDDVGIPIVGAMYEDMVGVVVLIEVEGVIDVKGAIDTDGVTDVNGKVGGLDVGVGNAKVAFRDMAWGMDIGIPNNSWPDESQ
ncbi:hypothetical protein KI387_044332, partial [Taxus chinensis]